MQAPTIHGAEVVLPCPDLGPTLAFFTDLGFRVAAIFPADGPRVAVIAGHGLRLRLDRDHVGDPGRLRLRCDDPPAPRAAPNGTIVEFVPADPPLVLPPARPEFVVSHPTGGDAWGAGRAGMQYRDLVPGRQGGRYIASQIRIAEAGPVPDYVHFHRLRFQIIYCAQGRVRVVYEDQGPPFDMVAGDCVVQPPNIRHRVLECSAGLEVIEVACPAEHETIADPDTVLPTAPVRPDREFAGQRFVRHQAAHATWGPWRLPGFVSRDTGIADATGGVGSVRVARPAGSFAPRVAVHDAEFLLLFVLAGALDLRCAGRGSHRLERGASVVLPPGLAHTLAPADAGLELLEVAVPGGFTTTLQPDAAPPA